ncbi:glycogenin-2 [Talpa occidentalis]|uniref:glycogenin-2 n=1 Tax=Talpa occidentalis TaxID=50954 RepID=UPI00188E4E4B|nr:glycogenin-2 [Talpa occidentalis]
MSVSDQAFVTLATDDISCQGALVLGQSLRNHGTSRKLVVLLSPQVSGLLRVLLSRVFDEVVEVNLMDSADYVHLVFLKRPELGVTLSKLHCWTLTHYSKCVFLDADTLVLANVDELFDRGELSAAPDPGWPDCFNSGVFVFQPSLHTHRQLLRHAGDHGSFDGGDQGLLNSFFSGWPTADIHTHLPFVYNLSSSSAYTYGPAFQRFGSCAKVVRFLGPTKPWNYRFNAQTGSVEDGLGLAGRHQLAFLNLWWRTYQRAVLPLYQRLRDEDEGPCPAPTVCLSVVGVPWENSAPSEEGRRASSGTASSQPWPDEEPVDRTSLVEEPPASPKRCHFKEVDLSVSVAELTLQDPARERSPDEARRTWEEGRMDYLGRDAFARIQEKLDRFLQ